MEHKKEAAECFRLPLSFVICGAECAMLYFDKFKTVSLSLDDFFNTVE